MNIALVLGEKFSIQKISELICYIKKHNTSYKLETYIFIRGEEKKCDELIKHGADYIFFCHGNIYEFNEECVKWIYKYNLKTIFMMDDYEGKIMASYVATKLGGALIADCINMKYIQGEGFVFYRAALGNSIIAKIKKKNTDYSICTIKTNAFAKGNRVTLNGKGIVNIIKIENRIENKDITILECKKNKRRKHKITDSKRVFGIGRGFDFERNSDKLNELMKYFEADIGGTRPIIENRCLEIEQQVGQSGVCIAPNIYVCLGVSGASQHLAGISNAKKIISINVDPSAPIIQHSDYVIIDDCNEVIEKLYEKVKKYVIKEE